MKKLEILSSVFPLADPYGDCVKLLCPKLDRSPAPMLYGLPSRGLSASRVLMVIR